MKTIDLRQKPSAADAGVERLALQTSSDAPHDPRRHLERARNLIHSDQALALVEFGRVLRWAAKTDLAWAEAANDIGVLHFQNKRPDLAHGFLAAAQRCFPERELYRANLAVVGDVPKAQRPAAATTDAGSVAGVGQWVIAVLAHCRELVSFRSKRVLEIGGALPEQVARQLEVASWTSVDPQAAAVAGPFHNVFAVGAENIPIPDGSIDLVFSCCAFEHIHGLAPVLQEIERVLRPGGLLFTEFSPIWSSAHGHHVWVVDRETRAAVLTFADRVLPPWAHLLWGKEELRAYLEPTHGNEIARDAALGTYDGTYVNRLFEDDYYRAFDESGLVGQRLEHIFANERPSELMQAELSAAHPGQTNFGSQGFRYVAGKR